VESDAKSGVGTAKFSGAVRELLADKLRAYAEKGMTGRVVRVMILGIPNVGKSTFINKVAGRKTAKTEDRPGVTRSKQWVPIDRNLELLDTPGILWPKFDDQSVGMNLAYTGAVEQIRAELDALVGLAPVKEYVFGLADNLQVQQRRAAAGFKPASLSTQFLKNRIAGFNACRAKGYK